MQVVNTALAGLLAAFVGLVAAGPMLPIAIPSPADLVPTQVSLGSDAAAAEDGLSPDDFTESDVDGGDQDEKDGHGDDDEREHGKGHDRR